MDDNWELWGEAGGVERRYTFVGYCHDARLVEVTPDLEPWQTLVRAHDLGAAAGWLPEVTRWTLKRASSGGDG